MDVQGDLNDIYRCVHDGRLDKNLQQSMVCLQRLGPAADANNAKDDGDGAEDVREDGRR